MSERNIEIVEGIFSAQRRGDMQSIFAAYDPEIEWQTLPHAPGASVYRGHDGIRTFFRMWLGAWREWDLEIEEISALGEHRVLTVFRQHGMMRTADVEVENRTAQIWTLREDRVIRVQDFPSRAEALEAAASQPVQPVDSPRNRSRQTL